MQKSSFNLNVLERLYRPLVDSHKGQNGRLLVVGGSKLFHASIFWSAQVASKIVDLVHFTSPANENNELVRYKLKQGFWEGIVVDFGEVDEYIKEDDCILIGPGMERNQETQKVTNYLLSKFPNKRWVVDGGALQEVDADLLNGNMIITPHHKEWARFNDELVNFSNKHQQLTILLKGRIDVVCRGEEVIDIEGGNAGLTKGGTGDVLAGLVAALYTKNDSMVAAQVASYVCKKAGESLAKKVGVYYSAGDLVAEVPKEFGKIT